MVDNCNGINHGYTLLYKPSKPIVTMGSEKDYFLSKSGPLMNDRENTALSVLLT